MSDIFLQDEEIQEIFKSHLTIESKVMSIETLFANPRRKNNTKYDPYYQRNYVWDTDKASYFIESILIGTEIPPLVFFNTGKLIEVIDGRQRFETIKKFIENQLTLTNNGLMSLKSLKKKNFDDMETDIKELFWDTKLRIIEFGLVNEPRLDERKEDLIKKEIFRRYNSGITPLKSVEIDKAKYIENDTNSFFKNKFKDNKFEYKMIIDLFFNERDMELINKSITLEKVMDKIRLFLVLHSIPISYYSTTKGRKEIVGKLFENLSSNIEDLDKFYKLFFDKINYIYDLKLMLEKTKRPYNRLIFECVFWALSIVENEKKTIPFIKNTEVQESLATYLSQNIDHFKTENSHFYKDFYDRYSTTATFFTNLTNIDFDLYINNKGRFKLDSITKEETFKTLSDLEFLRLNKPDASTTTIDDICRQMNRGRFLVRPPYQRNEAINHIKASAIIESILLGIKLPPIFVFKRNDGISEVVDGQQRLLSILGFIGEGFIDENEKTVYSEKNNFSLKKLNILNTLDGKKFVDLSDGLKEKIYDFNLSVVNIDEKLNPNFDPIDLFIRLNNKPYPIRENTFEMWNSYVDKEIISAIKLNTEKHSSWFHSRINNKRMENEELYATLAYLEYKNASNTSLNESLDIYKSGDKVNARIKEKSEITKVLNASSVDDKTNELFLKAIKSLESFIRKLRMVLIDKDVDDPSTYLKGELDKLLSQKGKYSRRTLQNFYVLWFVLHRINLEMIKQHRITIKQELAALFELMRLYNNQTNIDLFMDKINQIWSIYSVDERATILNAEEKKNLLKKQNNICPVCNSYLFVGDDIEIDHKKALAVGGRDVFLNLQAVHKHCNRKKRTN